ncbi:hypothetical protein DY023_00110 [Microbacterium bovistercoris]|uniref:Glycosyltransferase RgtA/B/C/D-like domain-containing protein n=1 Tax=Microbacterium bovistercoris TaxID=2293570 RepID=A0A371NYL2_9MICO|nr:hypothetical protein [Microbacterium bovistercoris]REJ08936.1 hypothetical protein DY023_00110 [Microbacterium bovistercoris]
MTPPVRAALCWGASGVIALVFLVLMSSSTSFFHTVYGGDAAIFRVIGSALQNGQELYVDVWDHKGPTLFFIEWLGQAIHEGRAGLFVLQAVGLTVSLALLISICRRFTSWLGIAGILSLVLVILTYTFEGGNLSEEFSLPFILFVLYGAVRALDEDAPRGLRDMLMFAAMGAAFSFVFFIRANNAIPIAGIFAGLLIQLILRHGAVLKRFGVAIGGFLLMSGVIIGWFAVRGTLEDMLNATFWFNLLYVEDASIRPKVPAYIGTVIFACVLTAAGVIAQLLRTGGRRSVWAVGLCLGAGSCYAVLAPTTSYAHYLTLIIPMIAFGAVMLLGALKGRVRNSVALMMIVVSAVVAIDHVPKAIRASGAVHRTEAAYEDQLLDVLSVVPRDRWGEVFPWSLPATFYLMTDTLPAYKYFITQPWWGTVDPQVTKDTVAHIESAEPQWILTPAAGTNNDELQRLLDRDYRVVRSNSGFILYERAH